jgi:hypothetical protein
MHRLPVGNKREPNLPTYTLPFILGTNKFLYVPVRVGTRIIRSHPTSSQSGLFQLQPKQISSVGNWAVSQALALNSGGAREPRQPGSMVTTRGTSGLPSKFVAQTSLSHCHCHYKQARTLDQKLLHSFPTFRVHVTSVPRKYHNLIFGLREVFLGCCNERHLTRPDHP